jgi:hypothetical protein
VGTTVIDALSEIVVGFVVVAALLVLVAGAGTWWAWRTAKRRVTRWRGMWQRGALRLRAAGSPWGPRGELAGLRWTLLDNLEQTERLLSEAMTAALLPRSLPALLPQLQRLATDLDAQLRLWEVEPDPYRLGRALPDLRDRVQSVVTSATRMRATALELVDEAGRLSREAAEADLRQGLSGLEAGLEAIRRLHAPPLGTGFPMPPPLDPVQPPVGPSARHR